MTEQIFVKGMRDDIRLIVVEDIKSNERRVLQLPVTYNEQDSIIKIKGEVLGDNETPDEAILRIVESMGYRLLPGCWWFYQENREGGIVTYECSDCDMIEYKESKKIQPIKHYKYCPYCGGKIEGFMEISMGAWL